MKTYRSFALHKYIKATERNHLSLLVFPALWHNGLRRPAFVDESVGTYALPRRGRDPAEVAHRNCQTPSSAEEGPTASGAKAIGRNGLAPFVASSHPFSRTPEKRPLFGKPMAVPSNGAEKDFETDTRCCAPAFLPWRRNSPQDLPRRKTDTGLSAATAFYLTGALVRVH